SIALFLQAPSGESGGVIRIQLSGGETQHVTTGGSQGGTRAGTFIASLGISGGGAALADGPLTNPPSADVKSETPMEPAGTPAISVPPQEDLDLEAHALFSPSSDA